LIFKPIIHIDQKQDQQKLKGKKAIEAVGAGPGQGFPGNKNNPQRNNSKNNPFDNGRPFLNRVTGVVYLFSLYNVSFIIIPAKEEIRVEKTGFRIKPALVSFLLGLTLLLACEGRVVARIRCRSMLDNRFYPTKRHYTRHFLLIFTISRTKYGLQIYFLFFDQFTQYEVHEYRYCQRYPTV